MLGRDRGASPGTAEDAVSIRIEVGACNGARRRPARAAGWDDRRAGCGLSRAAGRRSPAGEGDAPTARTGDAAYL
jgi:hypothetical protein